MRAGSPRQAGDVAEAMRAGGKVGTGPSFARVALSTGKWHGHPMVDAQWKGPSKQVLGMRVASSGTAS